MRILKAIALVLALAGWTFAACDARADATQAECLAGVLPAAADVERAASAVSACWDPEECATAGQWLTLARDRHAAALALCPEPEPRQYVAPFETTADPFELVAVEMPSPDPAWCAVFGTGCE